MTVMNEAKCYTSTDYGNPSIRARIIEIKTTKYTTCVGNLSL